MESKGNTPAWMNVAEIDVVYKSKIMASKRPQITSSRDAYILLLKAWDDSKLDLVEEFKILLLNRARRVLGLVSISSGGMTNPIADVRLILAIALKLAAISVILSHSHPSGNIKPSQADIDLTAKIVKAATIMDIQISDHIIVTREKYYSFADEGLI